MRFGGRRITKFEIRLAGGQLLDVAVHRYPVDVATRTQLIDLLQQVFSRSDVDWLQSMRGIYSDVLTTCQLVGHLEGFPVGSATVAFAVDQPEVCVIEDVMTLPAARGQGIARALTEQVVKIGFDAGCRLAYLGNAPTVSSVYEHVDFTRIRGVFMRREAPGCAGHETRIFTPGQAMAVRETNWGDLPGVVCLMAQPTGPALAHYDQGLVSLRNARPVRAVSNFTSVKYAAENGGGCMWSLVGKAVSSRVFGFASMVPGPGPLRDATARCDLTCHDHFTAGAARLLEVMIGWARQNGIALLEAFVAESDEAKLSWLEDAGFGEIGRLSDVLRVDGQLTGVVVLRRCCE